jgi:dihydropteroate synthase
MKSKDKFFLKSSKDKPEWEWKEREKPPINLRGKLFSFEKPVIMGILNLTPDSFYDGGRYLNLDKILNQTGKMIEEGAQFIDIGANSSRPGARQISESQELDRLTGSVGEIRKKFPDIYLSIDTFRSVVAKKMVVDCGVDMINDISAGELDDKMFKVIRELQVPYIIMHMKGTPENMQDKPVYKNVVKEVAGYLAKKVNGLNKMGVNDIIIDPGFGFGKTLDQNYKLLAALDVFSLLQVPLLAGLSRKSMIFKLLETSPDESLNGSTAIHTIALMKGTDILRVHDVKAATEAITIVEKLKEQWI